MKERDAPRRGFWESGEWHKGQAKSDKGVAPPHAAYLQPASRPTTCSTSCWPGLATELGVIHELESCHRHWMGSLETWVAKLRH
jgi:hypothetical protein